MDDPISRSYVRLISIVFVIFASHHGVAQTGYRLWLDYRPIAPGLADHYFQPREPCHPLFGAMPHSQLMMEFQITQEYLGFATNVVYLGTLFSKTLHADTYAGGPNSTVARVIDGC